MEQMSIPRGFQVLSGSSGPRLGAYTTRFGKQISTPAPIFLANRGAFPHLTPDNASAIKEDMPVLSLAAEDFLDKLPERDQVPIFKLKRKVLALPNEPSCVVVSSRRNDAVPLIQPNADDSISIDTCEGTKKMSLDTYFDVVSAINPDIVISPLDLPNLSPEGRPGHNRARKMAIRTERWLARVIDGKSNGGDIFASVLPSSVSEKSASEYNTFLTNHRARVSGLAFTEPGNAAKRSETLGMSAAARMLHGPCEMPQDILQAIGDGIDLVPADLTTRAVSAGVALTFEFPPQSSNPQPIGLNLWEDKYSTDLTPLGAATGPHHRAYIRHLLHAREMTGDVLLQLHNVRTVSNFFAAIRQSIANGTFAADCEKFLQVYGTAQQAAQLFDRPQQQAQASTFRQL